MAGSTTIELLRENAPLMSVGILTADLMALGPEIAILERVGIRLVHIDVMDGCFVPMMTVGPPFIRAIKTSLLKDVHLMIDAPVDKVAEYVRAGADLLTVHWESGPHIHRVLQSLSGLTNANDPSRGLVRGLALNPGTPVEVVVPLLDEIEMLLLLAVNPGWSGQQFIEATREKISRAKQILSEKGRDIILAVDGGVTQANFAGIAATGVDLIVTGSAVFDGRAAESNAAGMKNSLGRLPRTRNWKPAPGASHT
jgi:ribulose-phosphate 3-epimerase